MYIVKAIETKTCEIIKYLLKQNCRTSVSFDTKEANIFTFLIYLFQFLHSLHKYSFIHAMNQHRLNPKIQTSCQLFKYEAKIVPTKITKLRSSHIFKISKRNEPE